ncbi:MAG TPA: MBOAT family O-acyltransferase [Flavilitoribacter sp.]|nr:MBOAT family O-acyltransferase [Flavilitoribacter sp.]
MLFNSIDFAIFLPIVFVLYWFVTNRNLKLQNAFLILVSYIFYGWWDWRFLSLIAFSSVVDFLVGLKMSDLEDPVKRKRLLWVSLIINLGFLGFFKYFNFFTESFAEAFSFFGSEINARTLNIVLPVGISFYTFQTLSYTIDIYRKNIEPTRDALAFFAFVSFFPQLVAGPIERAAHLLPQFYYLKKFSYDEVSYGLKKMLWGLFMKVAVADRLAIYVETIYGHSDLHTGISFAVATIFFAVQIYCDFAGYSLIAIGCAQMFGFDLMENFRRPYFSATFKEFWSRWHISLSTWFRDYVYIPLGGNRVSKARNYLNLFVTFTISGLWHGANWTFVAWGALHGAFQCVEKGFLDGLRIKVPHVLKVALIFLFTCVAWVFFRAVNIGQAMYILQTIFTRPGSSLYFGDKGMFAFSILGMGILFANDYVQEYRPKFRLLHNPYPAVRFATIVFLLVYIVGLGVFDGSQFIYFQF